MEEGQQQTLARRPVAPHLKTDMPTMKIFISVLLIVNKKGFALSEAFLYLAQTRKCGTTSETKPGDRNKYIRLRGMLLRR